jgi:hypothetical protein
MDNLCKTRKKRIKVTDTEGLSENLDEDDVLKYWLDEAY